jgi:DNA-binding XRE family transcriptional regulator
MAKPRKKIDIALLKSLRQEAGLTQKELGDAIGISRETISAIENEKPETINSLEADVVAAWNLTCQQRASADTSLLFLGDIIKYFGFSEQNLIKMVKQLTKSDKQG